MHQTLAGWGVQLQTTTDFQIKHAQLGTVLRSAVPQLRKWSV